MECINKILSLKDMAIRRVVTFLFNEPDILASVRDFHRKSLSILNDSIEVWKETVEDKISDKFSKIGLPASLAESLTDTVKQMGRQIPGWKGFHEEYLGILLDEPILKRMCWTTAGALDYRKTAEEFIRSDVIDFVKRYQLASLYCLEDCIVLFWNELPEEKKRYFYDEKRHSERGKIRLQFWWPHIIGREQSKLDSLSKPYRGDSITFNQYAFEYSSAMPNKAAAEYFYKKLTEGEKETSLIAATRSLLHQRNCHHGAFPREEISEMFRYLLYVMTPDQQMRIFQEDIYTVLKCFLYWPLQDLFSEIADLIWKFLPEKHHVNLLWDLFDNFANSGYYFQPLFREFSLRCPYDVLKRLVNPESHGGSYFSSILCCKDKEALETTFRNVDDATKAGLVLNEYTFKCFHSLILNGRWDVVEVCLREARLSKGDRWKLKETFMEYLKSTRLGEMELKTPKWTKFFQFLDEKDEASKRCLEDDTPTNTKVKKS